MAVVDYFLKIDGIDGESTDAKHKGEIVLMSFSWGVSNSGAVTGGGAGKASNHDFTFVKLVDKASPKLMLSCANGAHHKEATLTVRKKGRTQLEYLKIKMEDLIVTSFFTTGPEQTLPQDAVSLNFRKITYSETPQKPDGSPGPTETVSWDFAANTPT